MSFTCPFGLIQYLYGLRKFSSDDGPQDLSKAVNITKRFGLWDTSCPLSSFGSHCKEVCGEHKKRSINRRINNFLFASSIVGRRLMFASDLSLRTVCAYCPGRFLLQIYYVLNFIMYFIIFKLLRLYRAL